MCPPLSATFTVIVAITNLLLEIIMAIPLSPVTLSKHPVILVISYDGFRYDDIDRVNLAPHLKQLRANGVTVPYMEPSFPTKTFPNLQSIATGFHSETHGIVDNTVYDHKYGKMLSGFEDDPGFWNYHPEVLPIWIYNELAGDERISGCHMWPGSSQPYGKDNNLLPTYYHQAVPHYESYAGSVPWEDRVDKVISWMTNASKPANLIFLYYEDPDRFSHVYGPNSGQAFYEISKADNRTAYLVDKLKQVGIYDKINIIFTGDHGMQDITPEHIIYLDPLLEGMLDLRQGGTILLHFVPKPDKAVELFQVLSNYSVAKNVTFNVWKKEDIPRELFYTESRRVLDYVALSNPGYALDEFNYFISRYNQEMHLLNDPKRIYGFHGYTNKVATMWTVFIGHGPAFRKGVELEPIKSVDIVPLISAILNIPDVPSNGSLTRVIDMIKPSFLPSFMQTTTIDKLPVRIHDLGS